MSLSGSLLLGILASAGDSLPATMSAQVREAIGGRWAIAPDQLELEWGRSTMSAVIDPQTAVRVSGSGHNGWFVVTVLPSDARPLAVTVRAGTRQRIPVSGRPLPAGARVQADDIRFEERVAWGPPSAEGEGPSLVSEGWEVRRALAAGDPLVAPAVQPPRLVLAGDPVVFVFTRGALRVERLAIAQGSARLGERVHAQVGAVRLAGIVTGPREALIEREALP